MSLDRAADEIKAGNLKPEHLARCQLDPKKAYRDFKMYSDNLRVGTLDRNQVVTGRRRDNCCLTEPNRCAGHALLLRGHLLHSDGGRTAGRQGRGVRGVGMSRGGGGGRAEAPEPVPVQADRELEPDNVGVIQARRRRTGALDRGRPEPSGRHRTTRRRADRRFMIVRIKPLKHWTTTRTIDQG